tara:strand:- start:43 stop:954 length:912 start_codon:yes stop_codon:yes gene_type:complete
MSTALFRAGQGLTRAYKKVDDFLDKGLINKLKDRFKKKPTLSKSKELVVFDPKKSLPAKTKLPKPKTKLGKLKTVGRVLSRGAVPLTIGFEAANIGYQLATRTPEQKARTKKLKAKLKKTSTKDYHSDLLKMSAGGDTMLKNPKKADLDKDGKLSSYEKKRGKAIESNMMKARTGISVGTAASKIAKNQKKRKTLITKLRGAQIGPKEESELKGMTNQDLRDKLREKKMMKAKSGDMAKINKVVKGLNKASKLHQAQAKSLKTIKASMGKSVRGYGAARTSGMGLQDEQLIPGKSLDYYKDLI